MARQCEPSTQVPLRIRIDDQGCWVWTGAKTGSGYGHISANYRFYQAHRVIFEALVGPIPAGMELDHLCGQRLCVRPEHLEIVTHAENIHRADSPAGRNSRKTHCRRGHLFGPDNTARYDGTRTCLTCRPIKWREYAERKRAADRNWRRIAS